MMPSLVIGTYTGNSIDLLQPEGCEVGYMDIIVPISRLCRFAGQTRDFYSVAEHSVHVSYLVEEMGGDPWGALWHDAAEAFLGDLISPVKALLPKYGKIEDRLLAALGKRFGFAFPFSTTIHRADILVREVEGLKLMPSWRKTQGASFERDTANVHLSCLEPQWAAKVFLRRMAELEGRRLVTSTKGEGKHARKS
jgi:hypothetical protein